MRVESAAVTLPRFAPFPQPRFPMLAALLLGLLPVADHHEVPAGTVTEGTFAESAVFPGTARRYSLYVPAQYGPATPAALMVFQDGHAYVKRGGDFDVPATFDRLIHAGEMPPTVAVLIDPGFSARQMERTFPDGLPEGRGWQVKADGKPVKPGNRSVEYDTVTDAYARFLTGELLPVALDGLNVSDDPARRGICGSSSGGIAAFSVAWFTAGEPGGFGKVISHIGSFTGIRGGLGGGVPGGHEYPVMIRKADPKPIRVALQDGSGDLSNQHGDWWLANRQMASALKFKGYDHKTWWGEGGHNGKDAGKAFADELRWLWRDWREAAAE